MSTLFFCQECNNLLAPKADNARRVMLMWCRSCRQEEEAHNSVVYRNDLLTDTREQAGVTRSLGSDPTLAHAVIKCPKPSCSSEEAVFFQDQSKRKETRMILFYVCVVCDTTFLDPALKNKGHVDIGDHGMKLSGTS